MYVLSTDVGIIVKLLTLLKSKEVVSKEGNIKLRKWGIFQCPICLSKVEKEYSNGIRSHTCGEISCKITQPDPTRARERSMNGLYNSWASMKQRCDNPNANTYKNYGAKGISYNPDWAVWDNFYKDMSPTWKVGLVLDRIDVKGNYNKENCQWLSAAINGAKDANKAIIQRTMEGVVIAQYVSAAMAGEATGLAKEGIARCARGERNHYNKFRWEYVKSTTKLHKADSPIKIVADSVTHALSTNEEHNMYDTLMYRTWANIKSRHIDSLELDWISSFKAFYADMGTSYFEGAYLIRIDKNKPFNKDNCKWEVKSKATGLNRQVLVTQIDKITGEILKEWASIKEAAISLSIDPSSMTKVCKGKKKSAGGFIWKYKEV